MELNDTAHLKIFQSIYLFCRKQWMKIFHCNKQWIYFLYFPHKVYEIVSIYFHILLLFDDPFSFENYLSAY